MYQRGETFSGTATILDVRKGGMGVVYICEGEIGDIDGTFAIKTCLDMENRLASSLGHTALQAAGAVRRRFIEEALLTLDLPHHQNLVETYAVQQHHGIPYILMEYVQGPSLRMRLARPLAVEDALVIGIGIAHGLRAAHDACGLIHRDLKPENVLLTPDGTPKISDFGLAMAVAREALESSATGARSADLAVSSGQLVGTLAYMAPEQLVDGAAATIRSDIYSFGVVLYEMLSGRLPFAAGDVAEMLNAIATAVPLPLASPRVPRELQSLVARCLAKRPDERFAGYAQLLGELEPIAASFDIRPWQALATPRPREHELFRKTLGLISVGRGREALALLERHDYEPTQSPELFFVAGTAYGNLGEHEKAVAVLGRVLDSGSRLTKRALFNRGNSLAALGRHHDAMEAYMSAMFLDREYPQAAIGYARSALELEMYPDAIDGAQRALQVTRDDPVAWSLLILAQSRMGNATAAARSMHEARAACKETPAALLNFATALLHIGEAAEAAKLAARCIEVDDALDLSRLRDLFTIIAQGGDERLTRKAVRDATRLPAFRELADELDIPILHEMAIDGMMEAGQRGEALDAAERELERRPDAVLTLLRKARVLAEETQYDAALATVRKALELEPDSAEAHAELGLVYLRAKRASEALVCFDKVLRREPRNEMALGNRASALMELERFDEALAAAEAALDAHPDDAVAALLKGRILRRAGSPAAAEEWLRAALNRAPGDTKLWDERYSALLDLGRYDDAAQCCTRILDLEPKSAAAWHNKGEALLRAAKHRDALQCYMNAVTLDSTMHLSWTGIGCIHLLARQYEAAISYFDKALALAPDLDVARMNRVIAEARLHIRQAVEVHGGDEDEMVAALEENLPILAWARFITTLAAGKRRSNRSPRRGDSTRKIPR